MNSQVEVSRTSSFPPLVKQKKAAVKKLPNIAVIEKEAVRVAEAYLLAARVREQNRKLREKNKINNGRSSFALMMRKDQWVIETIKKEQVTKRALLRLSPGEWRSRIFALPEPLRTKIGILVWWDYFGGRPVTRRWPELDGIIAAHAKLDDYPEFSREELICNLHLVGYSSYMAWRRITEQSGEEDVG